MGTTGTILVVLGAWFVGSLFLGLLVGRMLRFGRLRPGPRADDAPPPPAPDPARTEPQPPPRDARP